ncbi:MAG: hypothetical protein EKK55_00990 [Rhodocyclaceae bacterium]|nr:MAG: hypothetical protein EKK55_00990 [Rhodocyclaceae bacterium]
MTIANPSTQPTSATINGIEYVVDAYISTESMAARTPKAAALNRENGVVGIATLRRPNGRASFLANDYGTHRVSGLRAWRLIGRAN